MSLIFDKGLLAMMPDTKQKWIYFSKDIQNKCGLLTLNRFDLKIYTNIE
jgi:hypothetical protein